MIVNPKTTFKQNEMFAAKWAGALNIYVNDQIKNAKNQASIIAVVATIFLFLDAQLLSSGGYHRIST